MEDRRCALSIKKVELCIVKTDAHQKMSNLPMSREVGACTASTPPLRELELHTLPVRQQCSPAGGAQATAAAAQGPGTRKGESTPQLLLEASASAAQGRGRMWAGLHA